MNDGYCNGGNIPGTFIIENQLHYQDYEWYKALEDSELKDEALRNKAIMKGFIKYDDDESRPHEGNIDEYWWRIYESGNLEVVLYKVKDIATCLVKYVKFWEDWEVDRYGNANLGDLDNSTNNVLIPLDSWTSGLLVYRLPLRVEYGVSTSTGYGISSSLSNTAYSIQLINTAYPLPLDTAYQLSGTETKIIDFRAKFFLPFLRANPADIFTLVTGRTYQSYNDIKINLSKEFLEELQKNTYHGWIDEDVIDHIAKEELVEKFFCKFYPDSYDGEDEMLDEGDVSTLNGIIRMVFVQKCCGGQDMDLPPCGV
ncbi:hypothetical protein Tco_0859045 [Tanacetum coccineum]|uniref:Uncharacterized protein n=1 Tax=Tanacetum coccineum TaxID=301880 RepID=A0ABQ5BEU7_9ASTR